MARHYGPGLWDKRYEVDALLRIRTSLEESLEHLNRHPLLAAYDREQERYKQLSREANRADNLGLMGQR